MKNKLVLVGGLFGFFFSLIFISLTLICYLIGGDILCTYTIGLPLLPLSYLFEDTISGYTAFILVNTSIGAFIGLIFGTFSKSKKIHKGDIYISFILIYELLFILVLSQFIEGLNYFLLGGIFIFTLIIYMVYYKFSSKNNG